MDTEIIINQQQIDTFQKDGVVLIKGLFKNWIDQIRIGIEHNMQEPGPYAAENLKEGEEGRFFDDYCNWQRIDQFEQVIRKSQAGKVAAQLMKSREVQIFHDHILVKEAGTSKPTPWHQDAPYYFVNGEQTISFWSPMDPVKEATLRCIGSSHRWQKPVLPTRWLSEENFYPNNDDYMQVPDPDAEPEKYDILEWQMEPGDAVGFNFKILHGARGNHSTNRRRAFSLRFVGDDARYISRPGPTSPPFPGHNMKDDERLRDDWFPKIYPVS
jgi:ectoine hydroxylase-related dioxygenase (phytanoyl-CoA dioxygenase family)